MTDAGDPTAFLCHYTTAHTALALIVPTKTLKMNPYSAMRDPLENKHPPLRFDPDQRSDAGGPSPEVLVEAIGDIGEHLRRKRDAQRLLSLTRGDSREVSAPIEQWSRYPWARARMWEQYGDNHRGVCLAFDRVELSQALNKSLGSRGAYSAAEVKYTRAGFAGSPGAVVSIDLAMSHTHTDAAGLHLHSHFNDFFFVKTDDWASEFEYRYVVEEAVGRPGEPETAAPALFADFGDALRYIIVGESFPGWGLLGALEVARQEGVELRKMNWKYGAPFADRLTLRRR